MYSYEERMRAVELYIKLCKRARVTVCALGYPSNNALQSWYREYARQQDFPHRSAPRLPKFSEPQNQIALQPYVTHGHCISWTMRALGFLGRATRRPGSATLFPNPKRLRSVPEAVELPLTL